MIQITLMESYLIETLRSEGITDEEIINYVSDKRVDDLQKYHESFDFNGLYGMEDQLEVILKEGYQIKFLTMPGLANLIRLKYGKEPENDFTQRETSIENLTLTTAEKDDLEKWIAANWVIVEKGDTVSIVPSFRK